MISIHALLAESDTNNVKVITGHSRFLSTLSLRRATRFQNPVKIEIVFLSTLSLRRATQKRQTLYWLQDISIHALLAESDPRWTPVCLRCVHFYPRSPCGERHEFMRFNAMNMTISIHALLAESDQSLNLPSKPIERFLSTLSLRRATHNTKNNCIDYCISIHALLAESDQSSGAGIAE